MLSSTVPVLLSATVLVPSSTRLLVLSSAVPLCQRQAMPRFAVPCLGCGQSPAGCGVSSLRWEGARLLVALRLPGGPTASLCPVKPALSWLCLPGEVQSSPGLGRHVHFRISTIPRPPAGPGTPGGRNTGRVGGARARRRGRGSARAARTQRREGSRARSAAPGLSVGRSHGPVWGCAGLCGVMRGCARLCTELRGALRGVVRGFARGFARPPTAEGRGRRLAAGELHLRIAYVRGY